jgi:hypothetical protein
MKEVGNANRETCALAYGYEHSSGEKDGVAMGPIHKATPLAKNHSMRKGLA